MSLTAGDSVVLHSLTGREQLNGAVGTLECCEAVTGRWRVRMHKPPWNSVKVVPSCIEKLDEPIENAGARNAIERHRSVCVALNEGAGGNKNYRRLESFFQRSTSRLSRGFTGDNMGPKKTDPPAYSMSSQGPIVRPGDLYKQLTKEIPRDPRATEVRRLRNLGLSYFKDTEVMRNPKTAPQDPVPPPRKKPDVSANLECLPSLSSDALAAHAEVTASRWMDRQLEMRRRPVPVGGIETPDEDNQDNQECEACKALAEKAAVDVQGTKPPAVDAQSAKPRRRVLQTQKSEMWQDESALETEDEPAPAELLGYPRSEKTGDGNAPTQSKGDMREDYGLDFEDVPATVLQNSTSKDSLLADETEKELLEAHLAKAYVGVDSSPARNQQDQKLETFEGHTSGAAGGNDADDALPRKQENDQSLSPAESAAELNEETRNRGYSDFEESFETQRAPSKDEKKGVTLEKGYSEFEDDDEQTTAASPHKDADAPEKPLAGTLARCYSESQFEED